MTSECVDTAVPVGTLVRRWENTAEQLLLEYSRLPWWRWKQRAWLIGAMAALRAETNSILELAAQQQPILRDLPRKAKQD